LFGCFRPWILLPAGFAEKLTNDELTAVLMHERAHWKRGDAWAQELIYLAALVHWFNPMVWIGTWLAKQDCEHACDEFVLSRRLVPDPQQYGATLLKAVRLSRPASRLAVAIGMFENKRQIKQRIQMISAFKPSGLTRTFAGVVVLLLFGAVGLTRQALAQVSAVSKETITTTAPAGWHKNGTPATLSNYVVGVDRAQTRAGAPSAYVKSAESTGGFGGMMQTIDAQAYHGKRLRLSAWIKTREVAAGAHLWFRVDGPIQGKSLQFDNMDGRAPKGNTDWAQYSVVLDVPPEATALAYGIFLMESGQMWVSDLKFEEVGVDVANTDMHSQAAAVRTLPQAPVNLSFE
jgi:hypothetical protein